MIFVAALLASQLLTQIADEPPRLNTDPGCRSVTDEVLQPLKSCQDDEKNARSELAKQWSKFSPSDRNMCAHMTETYDPSYVELLSCLEMMRDARMPADGQATTGMGTGLGAGSGSRQKSGGAAR